MILLNDIDKKEVRLFVQMYESICVRYVHKYANTKSKEIEFCQAELKVTNKRPAEYIILYEETISHEFILDLVTLNKIPKL